MKQKQILLELGRWLSVLLAVVFLIVAFGQSPSSNADPAAVFEAITKDLDQTNLQPGDAQIVKRLYGLNPGDFESCQSLYPVTNMEAEELLLIQLRDPSQQELVRSAIQKRVETQKTSFDGYGLEQYDLLTNHCIIEIRGNYVLFIVHSQAEDVRRAFLDAL